MSQRLAALDGGTYYHLRALNDPSWAACIDEHIYLPELAERGLDDVDILIATCRSNPELIARGSAHIEQLLDKGGTVVAFAGTAPESWLPGVEAQPVPTNYWWWLSEGADSGLRHGAPEHPLFQAVSLADCTWHHHCRFTPPDGALSLIDHVEGGSIFYEDRVSTPGTLLISGLDPFFHHGSHFMPATTRFLSGFLPWLKQSGAAHQGAIQ